jgi:tetratricopeptide (TPR) repeat protein/O-antigen ligase
LYFDTDAARVFESGKVWLVQSLAIVALAAWGIARLSSSRPRDGSWVRQVNPLVLPLLAFVAVVLLGTLTSIAPHVSLWGSTTRLDGAVTLFGYVTLFAAVAAHVRERAQVERLVDAVLVAGTFVGLYAIAQRLGFDPAELTLDPRRTASTLGLPPFLAAFVTLVFPLSVARLVNGVRRRERGRSVVYALVASVQVLTMAFSQSRAAMLGILAGMLLMGVLVLLAARPRSPARRFGWIWMSAGGCLALLIVALNVTGTPLDRFLDPLRSSPPLERLARLVQTREGTGRVRILIWDATLELLSREEPIGAPMNMEGDEFAGPDKRDALRPLLGYGQDTMFSAFAAVYPAEYAHFEARGALVDRSHNETLDRLVMNGLAGLVAWYAFIVALFTRGLTYLGYVPHRRSFRRLVALLLGGAAFGACVAYVAAGRMTFVALGLPFGLVAGLGVHVVWEGSARRTIVGEHLDPAQQVLGAALLSALVGHFIQMQFGFSVAATSTYLWVYSGLLIALPRVTEGQGADDAGRSWSARGSLLGALAVGAALCSIWFGTCDIPRADIRLAEGRRRASLGQWEEAVLAIEAASAIQPHEDRYHLELARVHQQAAVDPDLDPEVRARSLERGVEHALEACRLYPYNPDNTVTLGRSYLTWGELADKTKLSAARAAFERGIALSPGRVLTHNLLARTLIVEGEDRRAIERLLISTEIDPRYPPTWVFLADVYNAVGDHERAVDAYLRTIELDVRGSDGLAIFVEPALLARRVAAFVGAGRTDELSQALTLRGASEETLAAVAAAH